MLGLIKIRTLRYMFAFLSNIRRLGNIKGLIQDDIFFRKITFYCESFWNTVFSMGLSRQIHSVL